MSKETIDALLKQTIGDEYVTKQDSSKYADVIDFNKNRKSINNDEDLKDRASNRSQREIFTKNIIFMMACELSFIAFLLLGVFLTPYMNSLNPRIQINLPPLFFSFSLVVILVVSYKFISYIPLIRIKHKNTSIELPIEKIFKYFSIILFFIIINCMSRHPYTFYFEPIELSENIINMIIYASITVFIKTTILAGLIIRGLYDALKNK